VVLFIMIAVSTCRVMWCSIEGELSSDRWGQCGCCQPPVQCGQHAGFIGFIVYATLGDVFLFRSVQFRWLSEVSHERRQSHCFTFRT
jgi:hypothetical protein